jgi:hypothetical protein
MISSFNLTLDYRPYLSSTRKQLKIYTQNVKPYFHMLQDVSIK